VELLLVRHAIAVDRATPGMADADRPLTEEGRAKMEQAAHGLRRLWEPEVILTSPLLRARQTADILLECFGLHELKVLDALATGDHDRLFAAAAKGGHERVAAIGHEPHISAALSYALTGDEGAVAAEFKKGAAALVVFAGDARAARGILRWLLQPAALRALAGGME
jgi:phosphohistidine phosphatase